MLRPTPDLNPNAAAHSPRTPTNRQPHLCCLQLGPELLLLLLHVCAQLLLVCVQLIQASLCGAQLSSSSITQLTQALNLTVGQTHMHPNMEKSMNKSMNKLF